MRTLTTGIAALLLVVLCGCQTASVPAVNPAIAAAGQANGTTPGSLQNGRAVLTTRCIACHGIQPIGKYSLGEWKDIVGKMSPRAKLSESQQQDLLAYLAAARGQGQ